MNVALLLLTPLLAVLAQAPSVLAAPSPAESPAAAVAPPAAPAVPSRDYRVGAGDVLEVTVFGNDDLSRTPTVQTTGRIAVPLVGDVPVAGLTLQEIQRELTERLGRSLLVNPQLDVRVREYKSQFASVVGEVNSPGRKPLRGRTRLIDLLLDAGGFTARASGEVLIARSEGTFEDGSRLRRVRLGGPAAPEDPASLQLPITPGDIVSAIPKSFVTIEGEVAKPGRYLIEGELTVSGAISSAGGLTRSGSDTITVRRLEAETGKTVILEVDLKAVRKGKQPDLVLQPSDSVSVKARTL
jgi:polysaccharide export outer membrane protein